MVKIDRAYSKYGNKRMTKQLLSTKQKEEEMDDQMKDGHTGGDGTGKHLNHVVKIMMIYIGFPKNVSQCICVTHFYK